MKGWKLPLASPDLTDEEPDQYYLRNLLLRAAARRPKQAADPAVIHIARRPPAGTADRTQHSGYLSAVEAATALTGMSELPTVFDQLLATFKDDQEFAESVIARSGTTRDAW
jgi:hypothetical protein